jgi:MFS family permease
MLFGVILLIAAFAGTAGEDSPNIGLIAAACVALALSGAADNVSSIYRNTMMQAAVPDAMRGRLQGVFIIVVAGGPRLGALYAGTLATLTTLWFPPLLGGFLVIGLVAVLARRDPRFRSYDAENPEP